MSRSPQWYPSHRFPHQDPIHPLSSPIKATCPAHLILLRFYHPQNIGYGLYRASVPVQRCTVPLPVPLLPLCAVQPVQSLSNCTTVHFTFTYTSNPPMCRTACTEPQCLYSGALYLFLYLYSPYGPDSLYRASVPVQRCTLPFPIPLLPLWTGQPVQSLSACTTVHFTLPYHCNYLQAVDPST